MSTVIHHSHGENVMASHIRRFAVASALITAFLVLCTLAGCSGCYY